MQIMTFIKKNIPIFIIVVFHIVGFVGFIINPSYFKWLSAPLLIGINWSMLLYCTSQLSKFKNTIVNAFFGAALMVGLDFFI